MMKLENQMYDQKSPEWWLGFDPILPSSRGNTLIQAEGNINMNKKHFRRGTVTYRSKGQCHSYKRIIVIIAGVHTKDSFEVSDGKCGDENWVLIGARFDLEGINSSQTILENQTHIMIVDTPME